MFEVSLRAYEKVWNNKRIHREGETPNPDVLCNRFIKFSVFASRCFQNGCDFIATGHYARINSQEPFSPFSQSPYGWCGTHRREVILGGDMSYSREWTHEKTRVTSSARLMEVSFPASSFPSDLF